MLPRQRHGATRGSSLGHTSPTPDRPFSEFGRNRNQCSEMQNRSSGLVKHPACRRLGRSSRGLRCSFGAGPPVPPRALRSGGQLPSRSSPQPGCLEPWPSSPERARHAADEAASQAAFCWVRSCVCVYRHPPCQLEISVYSEGSQTDMMKMQVIP